MTKWSRKFGTNVAKSEAVEVKGKLLYIMNDKRMRMVEKRTMKGNGRLLITFLTLIVFLFPSCAKKKEE